jgi:O-antigen ligase
MFKINSEMFHKNRRIILNSIIFLGAFLILFAYYDRFNLSINIGLKLVGTIILFVLILAMLKSRKFLIFSTVLFLLLTDTQFSAMKNIMETSRWVPYIVFTFIFLSHILKNRELPRDIEWIDKVIFVIIIAMFLSAFYSIDPALTIKRSSTFLLLYISVFWVIYPTIDSREDSVETINVILYAASIPFFFSLIILLSSPSSAFLGSRFRGYFSNPNSVGSISAILCPLLIWKAVDKKSTFGKIFLAVIVPALFLSGSRSGLLGAFLGSLFYLFNTKKKYRIPATLIGSIVILFILTIGESAIPSISSYLRLNTERSQNEETLKDISSGRTENWNKMTLLLRKKPLLGYGFGTEDKLLGFYNITVASTGKTAHNAFLGIAVQLGIIGFLLFFSPIIYILLMPINSKDKIEYSLTGVIIGGLVAGLFESWMYAVGSAFAFPFWVGIILLLRLKKEKKNKSFN